MANKYSNPDLATFGSQGTTPFKISDILSLGDWFGNPSDGKAAKRSSAVEESIDAVGAGAMTFLTADRSGNNKLQKKGATADAAFDAAASAVSFIPGIGQALSLGMQGFQLGMKHLAPDLKNIKLSQTLGGSSSYAGLAGNVADKASDVNAFNQAGVGRFFMGKKGIKKDIDTLNQQQKAGVDVLRNNQRLMAAAGNNANYLNTRNNLTLNGFTNATVPIGKRGLNTSFLGEYRAYKKSITSMKNGGTILSTLEEAPMNVIVNGPLHKELNHMADLVDVDITKKGVPVLTKMEEGGEVEQAAELERDEIIFHFDLTKKLEELEKEGTDEAAIKAGKLLVKEILKNTRDSKSKLLKTVV